MFERLDAAQSLTANQWRIVAAAILGDMLEFFDYFLIGFVLAFIIGPWQLTFGQSAIILLSSGIGAILGAAVWGRLADRIGRRAVFIGTVLNFSLATGILALTPDHGWIFLENSEEMRRSCAFCSQINTQTAGPPKISERLLRITLLSIRTRLMR